MRLKSGARTLVAVMVAAQLMTEEGQANGLSRLRVSRNGRFLVTAEGRPFFWLGDDAAALFLRLDRKDAEHYLQVRLKQGYTVVQAVAVDPIKGVITANALGELPFIERDPTRPNELYWQHVDWIVARANALGLYVGFQPGPGWQWTSVPRDRAPAPRDLARAYGEFLGRRYKDAGLVWILGASWRRSAGPDELVRAMAEGIRAGDGGTHLVTYRSPGRADSSSRHFPNDDPLLDFNTYHSPCRWMAGGMHEIILATEYALSPAKPILDVEPLYEEQPICTSANYNGYSNAHDVRGFLYQNLFRGAFGHTYGNHAVWQMHDPAREAGIDGPLRTWVEALESPGAGQQRHARALLESRPHLTRVPDDTLVVPTENPGDVPGVGERRIAATRSADGGYAMVYVPTSRKFSVDLESLTGTQVQAWWFNPRTGAASDIGRVPRQGSLVFTPPDLGETIDWVLVLDDVDRRFPPPGTARTPRRAPSAPALDRGADPASP